MNRSDVLYRLVLLFILFLLKSHPYKFAPVAVNDLDRL